MPLAQRPHARHELAPDLRESLVRRRRGEHAEGRVGRRHAHDVRVERARVDDLARAEALHEVAPAGECRDGPAAGHRLPVRGEVRRHPIALDGATERDAEARDDLIEHEDRSVPVADPAHALEVARRRLDRACVDHHRLHQDRSDRVALVVHRPFERPDVVPRQHDQLAKVRRGLAGARRARAIRPQRDVDVVVPAVIVAFEPDDLLPPGDGARQPDRGVDHLAARRSEADHARPAEDRDEPLGGLDLERVLGAEHHPVAHRLVDGLDDRGMGVPEERGTLPEQVVDVVVAIDVPQPRTLAPGEEDGRSVEADVRIDPARQQAARLGRQPLGDRPDSPLGDGGRRLRHAASVRRPASDAAALESAAATSPTSSIANRTAGALRLIAAGTLPFGIATATQRPSSSCSRSSIA